MKQKILIYIIMIAIAVVFGVVAFLLLPDPVAVQIGFDGHPSNSMPKWLAVLIPLALAILGAIACLRHEGKEKTKFLIVSIAGYVMFILEFIVNL